MASNSSSGPEAYTVSKMLDSINQVMENVGGRVELKRTFDNGLMYNTSQEEIASLDSKAKIKAAGEFVQHLSSAQKFEWASKEKERGNRLYQEQQYEQACEVYIQALVGLDFTGSAEEIQSFKKELQLPITCNLAACLLALKQWKKVIEVCNQALLVDPKSVKALRRRGQAFTLLEEFPKAKADFEMVLDICKEHEDSEWYIQEKNQVDAQMKKLISAKSYCVKQNQQKRHMQSKMTKGFIRGDLYDDKRTKGDISSEGTKPTSVASAASQLKDFLSVLVDSLCRWIVSIVFFFQPKKKQYKKVE